MKFNENGWLSESDKMELIPTEIVKEVKPKMLGLVWMRPTETENRVGFAKDRALSFQKAKPGTAFFSVHFIIDRDGKIYQLSSVDKSAQHINVGGVLQKLRIESISQATVSIEMVNGGTCRFVSGRFYSYPYYFSRLDTRSRIRIPEPSMGGDPRYLLDEQKVETVQTQTGREYAEKFPDAQLASAEELIAALVDKFKWERQDCMHAPSNFDRSLASRDLGVFWHSYVLPRLIEKVWKR